jgi:hypothetical protein
MIKKETLGFNDKMSARVGKAILEQMKIDCNVKLILRDEHGNVKDVRDIHNTVPNVGLYAIMDQLLDSPAIAVPSHMEVGTGSPTATKLGAYIAASRSVLTEKTRASAVITMKCMFAAGVGTGAITECGTFNTATQDAGDMYCSASFAVINKSALDSLEIVWTLTATAV